MSNLYFKKDVHKSIEGLLYGLYVYQYFLDTTSAPSQAITYWLDTVILILQVTEALLVFKVIKSEGIPRRSTSTPTTTTAAPARTGSPSSSSNNTPGTGNSSLHATQHGESGSGSTNALPVLVDQSTVSASSSSNNQPPEYIPRHVNNNNNSRHSEDLDDIYTEYYEDEEEVRFSTDLDRQQQLAQPSQGSSSSQRNRSSGAAARGASNSNSNTDESSEESSEEDDEESSEEDDEDPLGDDYEEVLEQETFVFQLRFQDLVGYIFSSQEALTMPDARTLTGATVANRVQSRSSSAQQRELPV
ncbi:hypothetical protein EC957_004037 [Mortierella hygrophila]|uniref:DUF1746 domain-containing protein n=1 Tax=Mortierella hygrophila TaxID=979708 RepID=A0A9P6F2P2_9FUNG|nr:hypothetical protein EC957_004037 [Mortierella hygrophila]